MQDKLICCIYVSRAEVDARSPEAATLHRDARRNNPRFGITGHLHREHDTFAQYIEGPAAAIDGLIENLRGDRRHSGMAMRLDRAIAARAFDGWDMGFTDEGSRPYRGWAEANGRPRELWRAKSADLLDFFHEAVPADRGRDGPRPDPAPMPAGARG